MSASLWNANIAAVARASWLLPTPELQAAWQRILAAGPNPGPCLVARDGRSVSLFPGPSGDLPLHSRFEPGAEAVRLYQQIQGPPCLVLLGTGGGYLARQALADPSIRQLWLWEPEADLLRRCLTNHDWTEIVRDPRVLLIPAVPADQIAPIFQRLYSPVLHGSPGLSRLQTAARLWPDSFQAAEAAFAQALDRGKSDWATQAALGPRWFRNMVSNLAQLRQDTLVWPLRPRTVIAAAGPSLEDQLLSFGERSTYNLIATDTALPALLARGLLPDLVVSLDCQTTSLQHLVGGCPPEVPFLFDLASPPTLVRRIARRWFFLSAHPLAGWLADRLPGLPRLDTRGGNVTFLAIQAALSLGAGHLQLAGADFSYPAGRTYARDTYVHPWFDRRQTRLQPFDHLMYGFAFRTPAVGRPQIGGRVVYTNDLLLHYHRALETAAVGWPARLEALPGSGLPLTFPQRQPLSPQSKTLTNLATAADRPALLSQLIRNLEDLPPWQPDLSSRDQQLWQILSPWAFQVLKNSAKAVSPGVILEKTRQETLDFLRTQV